MRSCARWCRLIGLLGSMLVGGPVLGSDAEQDQSDAAQEIRQAKRLDFGAFCVDNISAGTVTFVGRPEIEISGAWREVEMRFRDARSSIWFLSGVRRISGGYSACGQELPAGVKRILTGQIERGSTIRFRILRPAPGFALAHDIADGGLNVVLDAPVSSFAPLYGGTVTSNEFDISVINVGRFQANANQLALPGDDILEGVLRVGSYKLRVNDAKARLPGSEIAVTTSLTAGTDGAAVLVTIPQGGVSLHKGTLTSARVAHAGSAVVNVAGAQLTGSRWEFERLVLRGAPGRDPTMEMRGWRVVASEVQHAMPYARVIPAGPVTLGSVEGVVADANGAAQLGAVTARDLEVAGAVDAGGAAGSARLSGTGALKVVEISDSAVRGSIKMGAPRMPLLEQLAQIGIANLALNFDGAKSDPRISGGVDLREATLGAMAMGQVAGTRVSVAREPGPAAEFGIPFSFNTSPSAGEVRFNDPAGGIVTLTGQIRALRAAGTLWFGTAEVPPRIAVDPGSFRLALSGSAVRQAMLFGVPPERTEISKDLDVGSTNGFVVSARGAEGTVQVVAALLVANEPQLAFEIEDDTGQYVVKAPLRFQTGATLDLDLASLRVKLVDGDAEVGPVQAEAANDKPIRVAGLAMVSPKVEIGRLWVRARGGSGTVGIERFASQVRSIKAPVLEAAGAAVTIGRLEGTLGAVDDGIALESGVATTLQLRGATGAYRGVDGFAVSGEDIVVAAAALTEATIDGGEVGIARGALGLHLGDGTSGGAGYRNFRVTASGPFAALDGTIAIDVSEIRASRRFPLIQDKCGSNLQIEGRVSAGGFALRGALDDGIARGRAVLDAPEIRAVDTPDRTCAWNERYPVDVLQEVSRRVCWVPVIKEICKVVTDKVKVRVDVPVRWRAHIAQLDVPLSARRVEANLAGAKGLNFCVEGIQAGGLGNLQGVSVTPTFEARGDLANLVKSVWDGAMTITMGLATSAIVSTLTNATAFMTALFPQSYCSG